MVSEIVATDDVPHVDLAENDDAPIDLDLRPVHEALGTENLRPNVWSFEPGQAVNYHAHGTQEELFYVLRGTFEVELGPPGDTETTTVGPGTFWVAGPDEGHGHRYVGDGEGVVLAFGAPAVDDPGYRPGEA